MRASVCLSTLPGVALHARATPLRHGGAEPMRRICARVVAQDTDEVVHIAAVRGQRARDDAAVDFHPLEEPLDLALRRGGCEPATGGAAPVAVTAFTTGC